VSTRRRPKTPKFDKPRKRGFKKTKNLFGSQPKERKYEFAEMTGLPEMIDPRSEKEKQVARTLGDDKLAKKIIELQGEHPNGTLPELLTLHYLIRWNVPHWYQVALFGGHIRDGLIPDFVVNQGGTGLAIEVQGNYWHEGFVNEEIYTRKQYRMLGQIVNGTRIDRVVEVWENKLYADAERVLRLALAGIELGY
jgi:hypothetical protein